MPAIQSFITISSKHLLKEVSTASVVGGQTDVAAQNSFVGAPHLDASVLHQSSYGDTLSHLGNNSGTDPLGLRKLTAIRKLRSQVCLSTSPVDESWMPCDEQEKLREA